MAIDARVQRRPPRALVKEEDAAVEQAAELVLNDSQVLVRASVVAVSGPDVGCAAASRGLPGRSLHTVFPPVRQTSSLPCMKCHW